MQLRTAARGAVFTNSAPSFLQPAEYLAAIVDVAGSTAPLTPGVTLFSQLAYSGPFQRSGNAKQVNWPPDLWREEPFHFRFHHSIAGRARYSDGRDLFFHFPVLDMVISPKATGCETCTISSDLSTCTSEASHVCKEGKNPTYIPKWLLDLRLSISS